VFSLEKAIIDRGLIFIEVRKSKIVPYADARFNSLTAETSWNGEIMATTDYRRVS
jgi:hypothetical protein